MTEMDAYKTMRIQSLTSIVNHPDKESFMKKVGNMMKNNIKGKKHMQKNEKYFYRPMTEKDIPESNYIPKVSYPKDFSSHFQRVQATSQLYHKNRLDEIESQNQAQREEEKASDIEVPDYFFDNHYKIDRGLLKPSNPDELLSSQDTL